MIDFAGCEFGDEERRAVNRVMEGTWLASGKENEEFEKEFAKYMGTKSAVCVNSGSSANLLALAALDLPKGSKVLTSACGFPATLAPILHLGLEPVLVDYDITTHNIDLRQVEEKLPEVDAVILAHTLGFPVDMDRIKGVKIIEDCCEAVGAQYKHKKVGSIGTLGTYSFYPSHQMTALGAGGMVVTSDEALLHRLRSLRDWGKMSNWESYLGHHATEFQAKGLQYFPQYTYETVGYNMKLSEAGAAFGREQLKRLPDFNSIRRLNHYSLTRKLRDLSDIFILQSYTVETSDAPFGFVLTFREDTHDRNDFSDYLVSKGIGTRPFFAGNITRHTPFKQYEQDFPVADKLMRDSLFIGVWQGLGEEQLQYMADTIHDYIKHKGR